MKKTNVAWVLVMMLSACSESGGTPSAEIKNDVKAKVVEKTPMKVLDDKTKAIEEEKKTQALKEAKRVEEIKKGVAKADGLAKNNKNIEAIKQYEQLLAQAKLDNNKAAITLKLAGQFKVTKDLDKELAMYEQALDLLDANMKEPIYIDVVFEKTRVLAQLGKYEALEKTYAQVLDESFEKSEIIPMDKTLETYFSAKKNNIDRLKAALQKAYEKGDTLGMLDQLKSLKSAESELANKDSMYEMYNQMKSKGVYQAANSYALKQMEGAKGAVVLDVMHDYVRFLQWQDKPQEALVVARGLQIMPHSAGGIMLKDKLEKIDALVETKPQSQQ